MGAEESTLAAEAVREARRTRVLSLRGPEGSTANACPASLPRPIACPFYSRGALSQAVCDEMNCELLGSWLGGGAKKSPDPGAFVRACARLCLPCNLASTLVSIHLCHLELSEWPRCLAGVEFPNVSQVDLRGNRFSAIPSALAKLEHLNRLDMQHNEVSDLSEALLGQMSSLRSLQLNFNSIRRLPDSYTLIKHITTFQVCYNYIEMRTVSKEMATYLQCYGGQYFIQRTPDPILPGLWLGSAASASDASEMKQKGITHVLSVLTHKPLFPGDFEYLVLPLEDVPWADLESALPRAVEFISRGIEAGGILVHCLVGMSRSTSTIVAYLMKHKSLSYEDALGLVRENRPVACPNQGFESQLRNFEKNLKKEARMVLKESGEPTSPDSTPVGTPTEGGSGDLSFSERLHTSPPGSHKSKRKRRVPKAD